MEQWKLAIEGTLTPDQCLMTAVRASEILTGKLDKRLEAIDILRYAVKKHPKDAEAESLRKRIESLEKSQ